MLGLDGIAARLDGSISDGWDAIGWEELRWAVESLRELPEWPTIPEPTARVVVRAVMLMADADKAMRIARLVWNDECDRVAGL